MKDLPQRTFFSIKTLLSNWNFSPDLILYQSPPTGQEKEQLYVFLLSISKVLL